MIVRRMSLFSPRHSWKSAGVTRQFSPTEPSEPCRPTFNEYDGRVRVAGLLPRHIANLLEEIKRPVYFTFVYRQLTLVEL